MTNEMKERKRGKKSILNDFLSLPISEIKKEEKIDLWRR